MEKSKKINFFKRLKMALVELENYIEFTNERALKAVAFMLEMIVISAFFMIIAIAAIVYGKYGSPSKYVATIVPEFSYANENITIEEETKDEKKEVASVIKQLEPMIATLLGDTSYNKTQLLSDIDNNERELVTLTGVIIFLEAFFDLLFFWLMVAIMTSFIGWIILQFSRVKMKYSKLFALSIYASTLTIILTIVYTILNAFFGVYIELFDYLAMFIAYIYITAVIYMIRSDLIKQQVELIRIATIQAQVKEKMKKEDEKDKDENESPEEKKKESDKEQDKEKGKENKEEKEGSDVIDDEPDGSEI